MSNASNHLCRSRLRYLGAMERFLVQSSVLLHAVGLVNLAAHTHCFVCVCVGDNVPLASVGDGGREPAAAWVSRASLSVSCASFTRSGHSGRSAVYLVVSCVESRAVGDRVMQFVIYNFKSNVLQKSPGLNVVAVCAEGCGGGKPEYGGSESSCDKGELSGESKLPS